VRTPSLRVVALAFLAAVAAVAAVAATSARAHHTGSRSSIVDFSFRSNALHRRLHFAVYLPADYRTSGLRYPVVYFLHGLPAGPGAYGNVGWLRSALDSLPRGVILVAPQGSTKEDSDPEYLDWGPGRNWETAIATELPRYVDSHLRTIPRRDGRALVGLSAGGYGAVILALHHLDDFEAIESWSGYFHPTNPRGTQALDLGSAVRNAKANAHTFVSTLKRDAKKRPTFFAFYVGNKDWRFRDENLRLDRELKAAHVPHVFALYPGAHEGTVWSAHAKAWLQLAALHLAESRQ
jgi:S-formylglutathione hydrolase FrmB